MVLGDEVVGELLGLAVFKKIPGVVADVRYGGFSFPEKIRKKVRIRSVRRCCRSAIVLVTTPSVFWSMQCLPLSLFPLGAFGISKLRRSLFHQLILGVS